MQPTEKNNNEKILDELIRSISLLIGNSFKNTTKIYDGIALNENSDGTWKIRFNGSEENLPKYGDFVTTVGQNVKIFVPQGNANLSYFI